MYQETLYARNFRIIKLRYYIYTISIVFFYIMRIGSTTWATHILHLANRTDTGFYDRLHKKVIYNS